MNPLWPGPKWTRNFPGREFPKESYEEWHNSEQSVKMFFFHLTEALLQVCFFFFFFKGSDFISTCGFKMLVSVGEVLVHLAFGCCVTQFVFSISSENSTWEREDLTIERLCITFVRESWHVLWTCFIHPHSCLHSEREGIHILHH